MFEMVPDDKRGRMVGFLLTREELEELERQQHKRSCSKSDFIRLCINDFIKQHPIEE